MLTSEESFLNFLSRPISAVTLCLAAVMFLSAMLPPVMKRLQQYRGGIKNQIAELIVMDE